MLKRLFKWFVGLSAFVVLLLFIAPAVCGMWLEQRMQDLQTDTESWLVTQGLGGVDVQLLGYRRGWFQSNVSMRIGWEGQPEYFELNNIISHGPFPFQLLEQQRWFPQLAAGRSVLDFSQAQWPLVMPELVFTSVVDFAGNSEVDWRFLGYLSLIHI